MLIIRIASSTILIVALFSADLRNAHAAPDSSNPVLQNRWMISLGGFFPEVNSEVTLDSDLGSPGDGLDFEDGLGMEDSKAVLWGGARLRISRRNLIEIEYTRLNRSGYIAAISNELEIGDSVIQVGGAIDSEFDVGLGRLTYGFSAIKTDRQELVAKAGLHIADLSVALKLSGNISVDGEPVSPVPIEAPVIEDSDLTAPLPHFGLSYFYAFTPRLGLRANLLGFYLEINDIEGSILDLGTDVVYQPWDHFGVGAGLRFFRVNVDDNRTDKRVRAEFEFDYFGPTIYFLTNF